MAMTAKRLKWETVGECFGGLGCVELARDDKGNVYLRSSRQRRTKVKFSAEEYEAFEKAIREEAKEAK